MIAPASTRFAGRFAMVLALALAAPAVLLPGLATAAAAFGFDELRQLLQQDAGQELRFHEVRESPWLAAPVESRGVLVANPDGVLEKRVTTPRQETWRLGPERLERIGPDGKPAGTMSYEKFPALGAMAQAMRESLAGRFDEIREDFELQLQGTAEQWTLVLLPRAAPASGHIERIELQGNADGLRRLDVLERDGARTSTYLLD
ncbi:MAG: LolA-related protein [Burkholderiaceae bacterium]